jgi:hypothetical protein
MGNKNHEPAAVATYGILRATGLPSFESMFSFGREADPHGRRATMVRTFQIVLLIAAAALLSQSAASAQDSHKIIAADAVKWTPGPPGLPEGAQVAVLWGNPEQAGTFIIRAKMPDGYVVPAHWHTGAENLTILSGTLLMAMGDKLDKDSAQTIGVGGFASVPGKTRHAVWASGETVIEVVGEGPFDINYLDASSDPRRSTTGAR